MRSTTICRQTLRSLQAAAARSPIPSLPLRYGRAALVAFTIGGIVWTAHPDLKSSWTVYNDAAPIADHRISSEDLKSGMRLDPDTQIPFPLRLPLTSRTAPQLALVGLGVRKVSFLRIKVYSVGFYLDEDIAGGRLRSVPGWSDYSAASLIDTNPTPTVQTGAGAGGEGSSGTIKGEGLMASLLDQQVACAVRIVPTRNTDFAHLRDGFTRAIQARQKLARSAKTLSDIDEERISQSTQALKALFPAQSVPKGKALTLVRMPKGELVVEYERLGTVNDPWISRELMLAYFADKDVISPKLKADVAAGLEALCKR